MTDKLQSLRTGASFGTTSGVITTIGLITGLHSGTQLKSVVIGAVFVIAIADALSDALGIHLSEEAENVHTEPQIWLATLATFSSKLLVTLSFVVPLTTFPFPAAIYYCFAWGALLITALSWFIARVTGQRPLVVVLEHLAIGVAVIVLSHLVGEWAGRQFA